MTNLSNYKAVILAGGAGTRLYPITKEIPKPLLPVKRKPILNYLVDLFHNYGVDQVAVLINQEFHQDFEWWKKRYYYQNNIRLIEEKEPLGTFGGLCYLKDWIGKTPFFFTNGDELKEIDLHKMKNFHQERKCLATIALVKVPNPRNYGVVVCNDGLVEEFLEKPSPAQLFKLKKSLVGENPPSDYINSGFYIFSPEVLNYHPGPKFCMVEKDLFPKLVKEKKLAGFQFEGKWMDCGTWDHYNDALEKWGNDEIE